MTNLQTLFDTLYHLKPDELAEVNAYIRQLQTEVPQIDDPEEKVALLMAALAEFRAGLSDAELQLIVEAMNVDFRRVAGLHEHLGHAWVSDDFDAPMIPPSTEK